MLQLLNINSKLHQVIEDIWKMISDNNYNIKDVAIYFGTFASFFIILPAVLYILFFVLHFRFTLNSTDADSTYSPAFQARYNREIISGCAVFCSIME